MSSSTGIVESKDFVLDLKLFFFYSELLFEKFSAQIFYCETSLFRWFSYVIISCLIYYSVVHHIDVCLFEQWLFIIDLINNLSLKLINSINRGLNFSTICYKGKSPITYKIMFINKLQVYRWIFQKELYACL